MKQDDPERKWHTPPPSPDIHLHNATQLSLPPPLLLVVVVVVVLVMALLVHKLKFHEISSQATNTHTHVRTGFYRKFVSLLFVPERKRKGGRGLSGSVSGGCSMKDKLRVIGESARLSESGKHAAAAAAAAAAA